MSPDTRKVDIRAWVERAKVNPVTHRQRQATEIVLHGIARLLPAWRLYLKGGLLMGLVHDSPRQTVDIDLTAGFDVEPGIEERLSADLDGAFRAAAATLGYASVALEVHRVEKRPKDLFATARAPALKIKIIHTVKTPQGRTQEFYFDIDLSFNEPIGEVEVLGLEDGRHFYAYALVDLIAEKYRAILQQVSRRRERHQDVYDLHHLTAANDIADAGKRQILDVMMEKSRARNIEPTMDALADPEIRRQSEARWGSLDLEIGSAPAFSACFDQVRTFYESLPWERA